MKKIFLLIIFILGFLFVVDKNSYAGGCNQWSTWSSCKVIDFGSFSRCEQTSKCLDPAGSTSTATRQCSCPTTPTNAPRATAVPTAARPLPTTPPAATTTPSPTPSGPTPTVNPNITNVPESGVEMTIPLTGTADFCESMLKNKQYLGSIGDPGIQITSTAKISDIATFGYVFYNLDNLDSAGKPKPIMFVAGKPYSLGVNLTVSKKTQTINVSFLSIDRADLNWNFYMPKPKHIQVVGYFKNTSGTWSKTDNLCQVNFTANTIDPTPTPNAACVCATAGTCAATPCFFDKFPAPTGFTYANPIKCNLGNDIFSSAPSATDKNKWCQSYYKTKGDANGDGKATLTDYFYYKSVRYGAKVPPTVNVDFDGDGFVTDSADKAIILRSIK